MYMTRYLLAAAWLITTLGASAETMWHDPLAETPREGSNIHNQAWHEGNYHRLPARAEALVRRPLWLLSTNSAGLQLRFVTDSPDISVKYDISGPTAMPHMPATGVSGVDLYRTADRAFCFGTYSIRPGKVEYSYHIDRPADDGIAEYTLYLPLYNEVSGLQVGVSRGSSFSWIPVGDDKPIVVYGTSVAQGACASRPGMAWTNILSRETGQPVINLGFSGNGKLEAPLLDLISGIDAKAIVLDCLPNLFQLPEAELTNLVEQAVRQLRAHSDAPILLVEHTGYSNALTNQSRWDDYHRADRAQRVAYDNLVAHGVTGLHYLSNEQIAMPSEVWVDYVHMTDMGQQHHARAIARAIAAIP